MDKKIEINNSYEAAVKSGRWGNPGASLYNKIKDSKTLLKEAYLQVGNVGKDTSFSASGCKYPHHTVVNGELVVSIPGIKAALSRARQMGVCHGELKKHLERHYREMGIYKDSALYKESVIDENFNFIDKYLWINQDELMKESVEDTTDNVLTDEDSVLSSFYHDNGISSPEDLLEWMDNIQYDKSLGDWRLKSPGEVIELRLGNCHDQSLFAKKYFDIEGVNNGQLFFIELNEGEEVGGNTHTLSWFMFGDKYYWFEHSWKNYRGIRGPYESLEYLKNDVNESWAQDDDINQGKYERIEFFDEPHYAVGMDLAQYVDSWTGNLNEQANWIDRIVHNELFRESVFNETSAEEDRKYALSGIELEKSDIKEINNLLTETTDDILNTDIDEEITEASHGKLKYDFRYVYDVNTGHKLKIVYDLNGINVDYAGHAYNPEDIDNHTLSDNPKAKAEVQRNIAKKGNVDHISHGQKVLKIIDMVDNKNLDSATTISFFASAGMFSLGDNSIDKDEIKKRIASPFANVVKLKVGEIDNSKSFKSTLLFKGADALNKSMDAQLSLKSGRGVKPQGITNLRKKGDLRIPVYSNPNKKEGKDFLIDWLCNYIFANRDEDDAAEDFVDVVDMWNDGGFDGTDEFEASKKMKITSNILNSVIMRLYKSRNIKPAKLVATAKYELIRSGIVESVDTNTIFGVSAGDDICESIDVLRGLLMNESAEDATLMNILSQAGLPAHTVEILENMNISSGRVDDTDEYVFCIECKKWMQLAESIICDDIDSKILKFNELFESYKNHEILPTITLPTEYAKECHSNIFRSNSDEMKVVLLDEKSHGRLNFSFRMGIDVETGHLVKIVFDLNKEDVTGFGSHDDTHVIPEDQWDDLQKHIRSKGHNDFTSVATVKAIVDLDTKKRLNTVRAVGAMSGLQSFGNKPLEEREKLVADGAMFGGARTFTVGEKEPLKRFMPDGTYKTTTPAKSIKELEKIVNPHLHKESVDGKDDIIIKRWLVKSDIGIDTCCVKVKGFEGALRARSSIICIDKRGDGNYVLCKESRSDHGIVPGGGWDDKEDPKDAAIRELNEETFSNVKDVEYEGYFIEYHGYATEWVQKHVKDETQWWYGYYSAIYVGIYDGVFTGKVAPEDMEIGYQWKKVEDVISKFPKEYQDAIKDYLDGYKKESAIYTEAENDVTSRIKANVKDPEEEQEEIPEEPPTLEEEPTEEPAEETTEETPEEETAPEETTTEEEPKEEETPKEEVSEEPPAIEETPVEEPKEEQPKSLPKQADKEEANKNGVNRKKLYIAFIEHAKGINNKNVFGSIFDKDAFHVTYPYVPHELRYFYRLANPTLCVMENDFTFFAVSELKKINKDNKEFPKKLVFAAKPDLLYVFNNDDKHVYTATEGDNALTLKDEVAKTFDLFIQDIVGQGDILNSPPDVEGAVMKDDGSNQ